MKCLITGGLGYIGSNVVVELFEAGLDVIVVDNCSTSTLKSLTDIESIVKRVVPFRKVDIRDEASLANVFSEFNIDFVMHFAGLKSVSESVAQPLLYYDVNVSGTLTLLKVMERFSVRKLIFSSSATVYGHQNLLPISESAPMRKPENPYGHSKQLLEAVIKNVAFASSAWSAVCLRYFNPVGAHMSGTLGDDPIGHPNNIMPLVSKAAVDNQYTLQVFGDDYDTPDGTGVRDYIHVTDLALGHISAVNYILQNDGCEFFNLGTGRGYSVLELIRSYEQASGLPVRYTIKDRREGDVGMSYADPSKAKQRLGWRAERDLDDMCRDQWLFDCVRRATFAPGG